MHFLTLAIAVLALSSAALAALPAVPHRLRGLIAELALFLGVLGLLWSTALLLPPPASWLASGAGVLGLTYARAKGRRNVSSLVLLLGLALAAITFHFMLAVLELATSTRQFESSGVMLRAALERSFSPASLTPTTALAVAVAAGAALGQRLAIRSLRNKEAVR